MSFLRWVLDRLPRRAITIRALENAWRRRVHAARVPGFLYFTERWKDMDPNATYIDVETQKWIH